MLLEKIGTTTDPVLLDWKFKLIESTLSVLTAVEYVVALMLNDISLVNKVKFLLCEEFKLVVVGTCVWPYGVDIASIAP